MGCSGRDELGQRFTLTQHTLRQHTSTHNTTHVQVGPVGGLRAAKAVAQDAAVVVRGGAALVHNAVRPGVTALSELHMDSAAAIVSNRHCVP